MSSDPLIPADYAALFTAIRERVRSVQYEALQAVNRQLVELYWVAEISWSHNLSILDRCQDDLEREFYLRMARRMGWTRRVLVHQIENQTYEKTLVSQTNFADRIENIRNSHPWCEKISWSPYLGRERLSDLRELHLQLLAHRESEAFQSLQRDRRVLGIKQLIDLRR